MAYAHGFCVIGNNLGESAVVNIVLRYAVGKTTHSKELTLTSLFSICCVKFVKLGLDKMKGGF